MSRGDPYKVACGAKHTAAITESGELFTWGCGENGRLGLGNYQNQILPQYVRFHQSEVKGKNEGTEVIIDVSCGTKHTGVVTNSGEVFTFGDNESGQLGTGSSEDERFPAKVPLSHYKAQSISCGTYHTLILASHGHVYAFGLNTSGQLGTANKQNSVTPIKTLFPEEVKISKISASTHSAAISTKGELYVWGEVNSESHIIPRKTSFHIDTEMINVNTGTGFTLAGDHKGRIWGLGRNNFGQLGQEELDEASSLAQVPGIGSAKIKTFSCGRDYVIALADFPQEAKGLHEPKRSMDTIKDSVKTNSNRRATNERLNTKTDYYDSSDEVIGHQDPLRGESKVLESDLESLVGNHSHGAVKNSQDRSSKSRMIIDLAEKYTTAPGLLTDKYILNLKEGLKNFETHMDSDTDDVRDESRTFSSRNQVQDIKHFTKKLTPRKYEQDLKEGKIKNILVDIKILRLQNLLLEQQLEERSHQIANLRRKLKTTTFSTQRSIEKEQKMKELILSLEAQSLKYREECLKSSEELAKKGMELDKLKRVIDEKNTYIESLVKDNHALKELVHYFLQLKNIEQDSQHRDVHSVLEGRIQSLLDNIDISPTRDSIFNIQALMHNLDSQIHVDTDSQIHHTESIPTHHKSRQFSIDHHGHSASSSSPQSANRSSKINQRGLAVRLNENYTVPSPSRKLTPAKDSLGSTKTLPRDRNIPPKVNSMQHAEHSTAGDEIRISTRASHLEGNTKPVKMHTKSQCSLNMGSLISPKHPSAGQADPFTKFATSVKATAGNRPVSFHKKKFSEPSLNFKPVAHVIEERNNKHMINNYFRTLQSEKHKDKSSAISKGPAKSQKPIQFNTQPGISTPAKSIPKRAVPLLQISPFNDFLSHDKRRPESSQLYKKLLDMLNCPSKEGSANLKPSAKVGAYNARQNHHQK